MSDQQGRFDINVLYKLLGDYAEFCTHFHEGRAPWAAGNVGAYVLKHREYLLEAIKDSLPEVEKRETRVQITRNNYNKLCEMLSKHDARVPFDPEDFLFIENRQQQIGALFANNAESFMPAVEKRVNKEKASVYTQYSMER